MSHIYPENEKSLYYVEFERGDRKGEFTVFKRQWMHTEEEMAELEKKCPKDFPWLAMSNEVHPWNIFTSNYGPPGCMPDESWVRWMVDCLNVAVLQAKKHGLGCELDEIELPPDLAKHLKKE